MAYNKVTYKGDVLMDITDSTVTPETLGEGVIAYGANGERIVGIGNTDTSSGGIIEVAELPTENIDTNAFYLCNGEYYRYAEGGGNTWVFNDELTLDTSLNCNFNFEFEGYSEGVMGGTKIHFQAYGSGCPHLRYTTDVATSGGGYEYIEVYDFDSSYVLGKPGWRKEEYKKIVIIEMPTDETFLTWLNANAKPAGGWVKYVAPNGGMIVTENGTFDVTDKASVKVNIPGPTGDITVTENGTFDITQYKNVIVDISMPNNLVIDVDELPTENISARAVYIYNGDLYKTSDDMLGTWVFNDVITYPFNNELTRFNINFSSYCKYEQYKDAYRNIHHNTQLGQSVLSYNTPGPSSNAYDFETGTWLDEKYRTITITGGNDTENETFVNWLKNNATRADYSDWHKYALVAE